MSGLCRIFFRLLSISESVPIFRVRDFIVACLACSVSSYYSRFVSALRTSVRASVPSLPLSIAAPPSFLHSLHSRQIRESEGISRSWTGMSVTLPSSRILMCCGVRLMCRHQPNLFRLNLMNPPHWALLFLSIDVPLESQWISNYPDRSV